MPYVVTELCVDVKNLACIEVCPVDCIRPIPHEDDDFDAHRQVYIDPDLCIDCDACAEACPVDAPVPMHTLADEQQDTIGRNAAYFAVEA